MRTLRPKRRHLAAVAFVALAPLLHAQGSADPGLARLEREIARLSTLSGGTVGVGLIHLESGRELFLNGAEPFPMASTYKVPIAVQFLTKVDRGEASLSEMVTLAPGDLHPGSGTLSNLLDDPGVSLSYRNLLELMLLISDNSATDLMLKAAGGGSAVTERVRSLGVPGVRVDRPTIRLIADAYGVKDLGDEREWTMARYRELAAKVSPAERAASVAAWNKDPRDTATPEGMARLLQKIWKREGLSGASTDLLLDVMLRCQTGDARIKGLLPPGTAVMHKTGTLGPGTTNDVGIVKLPDGAGHVVMAVFVKEATADGAMQERTIAQVARAAYDYFLFAAK